MSGHVIIYKIVAKLLSCVILHPPEEGKYKKSKINLVLQFI